jgi:preprotein translocase subunit SecG
VFVVLYILFLLVSVASVFFVLLQTPKQSGLSPSLGGGSDLLGGRGVEGGIIRVTSGLAVAYLVLALLLNVIPR